MRLFSVIGLLAVVVSWPPVAQADETETVARYHAQYGDLRARVISLRQRIEEGRTTGAFHDLQAIAVLVQASHELATKIHIHINNTDATIRRRQLNAKRKGEPGPELATPERADLLTLRYASQALEQLLGAELDYQTSPPPRPEFLLTVIAKYDELWNLADAQRTRPPTTP